MRRYPSKKTLMMAQDLSSYLPKLESGNHLGTVLGRPLVLLPLSCLKLSVYCLGMGLFPSLAPENGTNYQLRLRASIVSMWFKNEFNDTPALCSF